MLNQLLFKFCVYSLEKTPLKNQLRQNIKRHFSIDVTFRTVFHSSEDEHWNEVESECLVEEAYCWFSQDVTKIQTTQLSILPRFYFHDVLEQLKTNFHTNFRFERVLGFVIEYVWISTLLWRGIYVAAKRVVMLVKKMTYCRKFCHLNSLCGFRPPCCIGAHPGWAPAWRPHTNLYEFG